MWNLGRAKRAEKPGFPHKYNLVSFVSRHKCIAGYHHRNPCLRKVLQKAFEKKEEPVQVTVGKLLTLSLATAR